jgi:uncharacterized protein YmfQ (DUF2313 family)
MAETGASRVMSVTLNSDVVVERASYSRSPLPNARSEAMPSVRQRARTAKVEGNPDWSESILTEWEGGAYDEVEKGKRGR